MSARGLNMQDVADRLRYHPNSVGRLLGNIKESGEANAATARCLAKAIGCPLADIMPEGRG